MILPFKTCISAFLLMGAVACQGYPYTYVGAGAQVVTQNSVVVGQSSKTDILFVIDDSGSMADKQANLKRNTSAFIKVLTDGNNNFHLGVVTTDMFAPTDSGRLRSSATNGGPVFFASPDPNDRDADAKRAAIVTGFGATIDSLGVNGSSNEAGMLAVLYALASSDPAVVKLNEGFLRDDADLAVIIMSDEDDCSFLPQYTSDVAGWNQDADCYQKLQNLYPVEALVDLFAKIKGGDIGRVRVGVITGGVTQPDGSFAPRGCMIGTDGKASDACGCWLYSNNNWFCSSLQQDFQQPCSELQTCPLGQCSSTNTNVCDTPTCPATPARRYSKFVEAFGARRTSLGYPQGTLMDSICQAQYDTTLIHMAQSVVLSNCFELAAPPVDPKAISITLKRLQSSNTYGPKTTLPRYDPSDPTACQSCGQCPNGAWQSAGTRSVCLTCGLQESYGDTFQIQVLNASTQH